MLEIRFVYELHIHITIFRFIPKFGKEFLGISCKLTK